MGPGTPFPDNITAEDIGEFEINFKFNDIES